MIPALSAVRPFGFLALALAGAVIWLLMAPRAAGETPSLPSATQYETLISQALRDNDANDARTDSAPQQQVVNGWVARDLLTIIAKSNADLLRASGAIVESNGTLRTNPFDERIPALLGLVLLTLVWDGLTRPAARAPLLSHPAPLTI